MWRDFCCFTWNPACQDSRRNANIHFQASSHVSCLQEHHFTEVALWKSCYTLLLVVFFTLLVNFSRGLFTIKWRIRVQPLQACLLRKKPPYKQLVFPLNSDDLSKGLHSAKLRNSVLHSILLCIFRVLSHCTQQKSKYKMQSYFLRFSSFLPDTKNKKDSTSKDAFGECHLLD